MLSQAESRPGLRSGEERSLAKVWLMSDGSGCSVSQL